MISLHPVELTDKLWMDPLVWAEGSSSADFNFGNIYLWDTAFRQLVGRVNDRVIVMPSYEETPFFAMPIGKGDLRPVLDEMAAHAREAGIPLNIRGVTAEHLPMLQGIYGERMQVTDERPVWDYLYSAESLATLSGKHLHGKRNHINRFEADYAGRWHYRAMTADDNAACLALLENWNELNPDSADEDEDLAIRRGFDAFEALQLEGGMLYLDDKLIAFTMGEQVCGHTVVVHFEKAFADINGAYPMINREFVRQIRALHPQIEWINREDDMGLDSLRQAKLSYHPAKMVEKYSVVIENE